MVGATPAQQIIFQADVRAVPAHPERLQRLEQERQDQVKPLRLPPVVEALEGLRGVPFPVAVTLVASRGDLTRVGNPRHVRNYLGLIPSAYASGGRRRQGSLTTAGNTHARRALDEGAWADRAPRGVVMGQTADERVQVRRDSWSSRTGCPPPAQAEPLALPADQRGWLDPGQRLLPGEPAGEPDQGDAGGMGGARRCDATLLIPCELCAQKEVVRGKRGRRTPTEPESPRDRKASTRRVSSMPASCCRRRSTRGHFVIAVIPP